jgi:hypothetical protein
VVHHLQRPGSRCAGRGGIVGRWQGGKTENDPIHGGYLNLSFVFEFGPDGSYREAAYMGNSQVMFATGIYQAGGGVIQFLPQSCQFASQELAQAVRYFPIPTDVNTRASISFSPLAGGGQLSLQDLNSGDNWGLKPAR